MSLQEQTVVHVILQNNCYLFLLHFLCLKAYPTIILIDNDIVPLDLYYSPVISHIIQCTCKGTAFIRIFLCWFFFSRALHFILKFYWFSSPETSFMRNFLINGFNCMLNYSLQSLWFFIFYLYPLCGAVLLCLPYRYYLLNT